MTPPVTIPFICPVCGVTLAADKGWLDVLFQQEDEDQDATSLIRSFAEDWHLSQPGEIPIERHLTGSWIRCPACNHVLVRFSQVRWQRDKAAVVPRPTELSVETWIVVPRHSSRRVPQAVQDLIPDQARYYREAANVLEESPAASVVLSRRVVADLLAKFAGRNEFRLEERIDAFNEDKSHPIALRENLHHLRELGNFGAHSQEDDQASIINTDRDEAEWALDIIERFFDYFIVGPARDREIRARMDKKIEDAGRKPLPKSAKD